MDTLNAVLPITIGLQHAGDSHSRRVRIVVILGGLASILFGLPWVAFFAIRGEWMGASADCAVILGGVFAIRMARLGRLRGAAILLVASLFTRLFALTLFIDVPNAQVPRSLDHFLIPLAVAAYLMLKHENVWLRHGLAWGCLASVIFFSSSRVGVATRLVITIPNSVRGPATWVTNSAAMLLLFLLLQIFVADIDRLEALLHRARVRTVALAHLATPIQFNDSLTRLDESIASTLPQNASQISEAQTQAWQRTQAGRTRLTVLASSGLLIAFGSVFGVYFILQGIWPMELFDGAFVALGLSLWMLTRHQHQRAATIGLVVGMMLIFGVISVILDIPTLNVPRAMHYWFLPLSLGAYFLLRDENAWIHNGLPIACLVAFVVLGSSNWGFVTNFIVPDSDRPAPWLSCTCALGVLYFLVYILVGDIKRLEDRLGHAVRHLFGHNRAG